MMGDRIAAKVKANVRGGPVLAHVQDFADALADATGAESFGTYPGHEPTLDRAIDVFVPVDSDVLGNAITAFGIANLDRYGVWYLIYRQRIYNPQIGSYWRAMEDRGSPTANHFDHVHFSFNETAPDPSPDPTPQGDPHMLTFRYIADGQDWVFDGPSRLFFQCNDAKQITEVLDPLGVKALGQVSATTHRRYSDLAKAGKFAG